MLFLYRPPQTWMPYALPKHRTAQAEYNRRLQAQFAATRRVPQPAAPRDRDEDLRHLDALRDSRALTAAEYETEKTRVLAAAETDNVDAQQATLTADAAP